MDAVEFIRERNRMCKSFGDGCMSCPFYKEDNHCMAILWEEEMVPIVEKWSEEHPARHGRVSFWNNIPMQKLMGGMYFVLALQMSMVMRYA